MEEQKHEESVKDLGGEEEEEAELVRALPADAVKELLSEGVCARCIFRLFGLQGRVYASPSSLSSLFATTQQLCTLCLGILQFTYYSDDTQTLLQNHNLPLLIADAVKRHAYHFHSFSLEVSIPPIILHNDTSLR
ncbi:unnamed protein product [Sphenostylis stenocarpa]|uniref:Uncharacterized protein n=1 Tax=Sphenostylis stenocarpa TaxID=92480 RepID=A0AA86TM55_9FABA|nr:unnamed protein product [Sphenostylis stenocarpa]